MPYTIERLQHINDTVQKHGLDKASELLELKHSTIERRMREFRNAMKEEEDTGPILVMPDLHAPYNHQQALDFLAWVHDHYGCRERVASVGDMYDLHSMSFHKNEPDALSPQEEYDMVCKFSEKLAKLFPYGDMVMGNHDSIPARKMVDCGLTPAMLKSPNDLFNLPDTWTLHQLYYVLEPKTWDVLVEHGVGSGGKYGCANTAKEKRCSYVQGHTHSNAAVIYSTNHNSTIFGMNVGCLVDHGSLAQRYGKYSTRKGVLGCGVVYNGSYAEFVPIQAWSGYKGED